MKMFWNILATQYCEFCYVLRSLLVYWTAVLNYPFSEPYRECDMWIHPSDFSICFQIVEINCLILYRKGVSFWLKNGTADIINTCSLFSVGRGLIGLSNRLLSKGRLIAEVSGTWLRSTQSRLLYSCDVAATFCYFSSSVKPNISQHYTWGSCRLLFPTLETLRQVFGLNPLAAERFLPFCVLGPVLRPPWNLQRPLI